MAIHASDILHHASAFVQQFDNPPVHFIDQNAEFLQPGASFLDGHTSTPPLRPRVKSSSRCSNKALPAFSSITRTTALPTTTASTNLPNSVTCSGFETPNPTASGRSVTARIAF